MASFLIGPQEMLFANSNICNEALNVYLYYKFQL
jgi:hypothetical protein